MEHKQSIELEGASVQIVGRHHAALHDLLLQKFGCEATFEGVDFQDDSSSFKKKKAPEPAPEPPSKRYEVDLPLGVRVSVWKADLTTLTVDAVVNAANSQLNHGGGLAAALSEVGGPQIQRESKDYVRQKGHLKTGEAIICDAGRLPCNKLIHAVGPHLTYRSDVTKAKPLLEKTIRSILDLVGKHRVNTVAIPAISSGLFNYPLPDCADTIVNTVKHYFASLSTNKARCFFNPKPVEILLVNHDEPTVIEMERACSRILGRQSSTSYSQAVSSNTRGAANTSPITVQIGNVLVMLKKDFIEEQQTDIIVNTASVNKDLSIGAISRTLLKKAGIEMQAEIYKARPSGLIVITQPYQLKCKEVFHTFCAGKDEKDAKQILHDSVRECLWMTVTKHYSSIAFPAIGTGALNFSGKEVASIMSSAVAELAANCHTTLEVHFVIFPSDTKTFKAFEEQMKTLKSKQHAVNVPLAIEYPDHSPSKKAVIPHISLMSPSKESMKEAKNWLTQLLRCSDQVDVSNNFIQHFSDEEYRQLAYFAHDGVSVEEFFTSGHACISLHGESQGAVVEAALQVEVMLNKVQQMFVKEETREMNVLTGNRVSSAREAVDGSSKEFLQAIEPFRKVPLSVVKVEKVKNTALDTLFSLKQEHLQCFSTRKMFQCIPAQFCDMVSRIGFHAEISPPEAPDFGEGIYFAATVEKAMEVWKGRNEEYLYVVVAEVLEGSSTLGKRGLIMPPAMTSDPSKLYNSVHGGPEISVIFSGYQAVPRYIITCGK